MGKLCYNAVPMRIVESETIKEIKNAASLDQPSHGDSGSILLNEIRPNDLSRQKLVYKGTPNQLATVVWYPKPGKTTNWLFKADKTRFNGDPSATNSRDDHVKSQLPPRGWHTTINIHRI